MSKHSRKNLSFLTGIAILLTGVGVVATKTEAQTNSTVGCPHCNSTSQINASFSNGTGATVWNVYMRPSGQSNWGIDQLGNKTLPPSEIWRIGLPRNFGCFWDVRFQYRNGSFRDYPRLNFCANPGIGLV